MAIDPFFNPITSGYNVDKINVNFENLKVSLQDALSRTGESPNQMETDLDMNGNNILNIKSFSLEGDYTLANYVEFAKEWAVNPEDVLVSVDAGGDGVDDYSAYHYSLKASVSASNALQSETNAQASATSAATSASEAQTIVDSINTTNLLRSYNNLSDLDDVELAKSNLGLPDFSTFVLKSNNLSDLTSLQQARFNLGVSSEVQQVSVNSVVGVSDRSKLVNAQAAITITLDSSTTLGNGWYVFIRADVGNVTVNTTGGDLINGQASVVVPQGSIISIWCSGTTFYADVNSMGVSSALTVGKTVDQTVSANVETKVVFDDVKFDALSEWDVVNNRFSPVNSGYYRFSFTSIANLNSYKANAYLRDSSGVKIYSANSYMPIDNWERSLPHLSVVHYINAGDWVDIAVKLSGTPTRNLLAKYEGVDATYLSINRA